VKDSKTRTTFCKKKNKAVYNVKVNRQRLQSAIPQATELQAVSFSGMGGRGVGGCLDCAIIIPLLDI